MYPRMSQAGVQTKMFCSFEEMRQPPYYPDPAHSDYHLFPNLKETSVRDFQLMMSSSIRLTSGCIIRTILLLTPMVVT